MRYIATFVSEAVLEEPVIAISHTANYAIEGVRGKLIDLVCAARRQQILEIATTGNVPDRLAISDFERDAFAVLHGSDDLKPHIAVRHLPPSE